jgi:hypothetical protein
MDKRFTKSTAVGVFLGLWLFVVSLIVASGVGYGLFRLAGVALWAWSSD